jgi:nucleoid-associated protein YgaU
VAGFHPKSGGGMTNFWNKVLGKDDKKDDGNKGKQPDFSNVQGGSSSTAAPGKSPDFSNVQGGSSSTAAKVYVVVSGDSLSKIAQREYGAASEWKRIYEANRGLLKDPDKIFPGQKLTIPPKN